MADFIVTGAGQGIGFHFVKALLESGHRAAVLDLRTDGLAEVKGAHGEKLLLLDCDVRSAERVEKCVGQAAAAFGRIDCAVHNACVCTFDGFMQTGEETFRDVLDVNYCGALRLTRAVLPVMLKQGGGKIAFTSSGVGVTGFSNISPYASSKGALEALAKCLRVEYRDAGVSFHILHPPLTRTASSAPLPVPAEFKADPEKVGRGLARRIHKKRFVICHSATQSFQTWLAYRFPLAMGSMMDKMTKRTADR